MYKTIFESDNGNKYVFGTNGNTVFDMDFGNGVSVDIGTSQGFSQIGETVQSVSVGGRVINVKGVVYGDVQILKKRMRKIFSPFTSGKLIFEDKYYTRVYIKDPPSFSPIKNDGRFTMRFFAPFPFFFDVAGSSEMIGEITPAFRFPVNYSVLHKFGTKSDVRYKNIYNDGDVKVPFSVYLSSTGTCTNVTITNLVTFKKLGIDGVLNAGESVEIYRDDNNILKAELTADGVTTDILYRISEDSSLFELDTGDNIIMATDDEGGNSLMARITFNHAVVAVYES